MSAPNDHALAVLKSHGRSFYFASHLLGPLQRDRAARLYAFCRYVDDLADESTDKQQASVALDRVDAAVASSQSEDPRVLDMIDLMRATSMPTEPVRSLIAGVQSDLTERHVKDEAELLRYAYQVAGTVGLMMCVVLDVTTRAAWPYAIDLGVAMQLTNIARDVGEDAKMGRVYLPANWVGGLSATDVVTPPQSQAIILEEATKRLLIMADSYYWSGLQGIGFLPRPARYAILVAAHVYRKIGKVVARNDYRSWQQRAVVSTSQKVTCAASALTSYALATKLRPSELIHDAKLHEHLRGFVGADQQFDA